MGLPLLVRQYLYIESGPKCFSQQSPTICRIQLICHSSSLVTTITCNIHRGSELCMLTMTLCLVWMNLKEKWDTLWFHIFKVNIPLCYSAFHSKSLSTSPFKHYGNHVLTLQMSCSSTGLAFCCQYVHPNPRNSFQFLYRMGTLTTKTIALSYLLSESIFTLSHFMATRGPKCHQHCPKANHSWTFTQQVYTNSLNWIVWILFLIMVRNHHLDPFSAFFGH